MKNLLSMLILAFFAGTAFSGCASRSPVEKRIDKNPALFEELGAGDKDLVLGGEVSEGMSRDAVFLAWGRPDVVRSGSREGKGRERWGYFDRTAVHTASVGFGTYGPSPFFADFGVHPRYGYGVGPGWGYGRDLDFGSRLENPSSSKTIGS